MAYTRALPRLKMFRPGVSCYRCRLNLPKRMSNQYYQPPGGQRCFRTLMGLQFRCGWTNSRFVRLKRIWRCCHLPKGPQTYFEWTNDQYPCLCRLRRVHLPRDLHVQSEWIRSKIFLLQCGERGCRTSANLQVSREWISGKGLPKLP